jgi:O-acetyl-ADP-ribose deacetylase (regulator of RNase III)
MPPEFETVFVDENPDVVNALALCFGRKWPERLHFVLGNIFNSGPGVIATPTNSEGEMSTGFDLQLKMLFPNIEDRLQNYIHSLPSNRLKVGATVWIETGDRQYPAVILSPTFRTPWDLATPNRVYRAAFAVFRAAQTKGLTSYSAPRLLVPGFGTGVGGLAPEFAARKIVQAYCRAIETSNDCEISPDVLRLS